METKKLKPQKSYYFKDKKRWENKLKTLSEYNTFSGQLGAGEYYIHLQFMLSKNNRTKYVKK